MKKKLNLKLSITTISTLSIASIAVACTNPNADKQIERWTLETNFERDINTDVTGYLGWAGVNYNVDVLAIQVGENKDGMTQSVKSSLLKSYNSVLKNINNFFDKYEGKTTYPASIKTKIEEITKVVNDIPLTNVVQDVESYYKKTYAMFQEVRELAKQIKLI
ncbi:hypothetical protein [Mycoplasmopsis agassizii]|uniref:Lipoprotein n=1 Tax=Mycoplasmopsis agassizii TaxID=33922 RepID=A0ABX4H4J2_9BACT|nr:hypothetical protein [Mycoplasmopsis agassizii]PAF54812.1 hypothetical protein CJF60_03690 [Mycoplasmopsis agassizii]SMC19301.1 hypothetical protein SAMN02745179_00880 [Mycoplasmopsis agassizii]